MKRNRVVALIAVALILGLTFAATLVFRSNVERRRVFRPAGEAPARVVEVPPVANWTQTFQSAGSADLVALLSRIEAEQPDLYRKWSLAYLHARALVAEDEGGEAAAKLAPFLEEGHPFRARALYHRASIAEGEEASRYRTLLVTDHPDSIYFDAAVDEELAYLSERDEPEPLIDFASKVAPAASTERRREMSSRIVEALADEGQLDAAFSRGLALLDGSISDDAADRVARALDRPEIVARLTPEQLAMFGETFQRHRHYERAIAYLRLALQRRYSDDLQFALGRSHFGHENFEESQAVYLRGAERTQDANFRSTFFFHAARSAQLRGDDRAAEELMTRAIAVKGKFPATTAALTQRIRTRLHQRRFAEAASDLALLRRIAGNERAILDGALAYGVGMLGAGNPKAAIEALSSIPRNLRNDYDDAEIAYWYARALEESDPRGSFNAYLDVLRAEVPTHFAYLSRARLDSPAMAPKVARELALREAEVAELMAAKKYEAAKRLQTDRILLSSRDRAAQLKTLAAIYGELPPYRRVLELAPAELPRFPDVDASDPSALLMAMGLHDEAVPAIEERWGLRPMSDALTRSYALNLAGASRESIYAIEVMMKSVPDDFHPDLLPSVVRQLLYPRYFYPYITQDAERYAVDPALLLSIMREESRFNPRAKSQAAARGLLQFIITTARDIGRAVGLVDVTPEDLYDPRIIIRLGAKYVSELGEQLGGDRYRIVAAYNAGPKQSALWSRLQAAPGDDYFLTAVNFDETKHYVRKVMNSYQRYREIYGDEGPKGGLRVAP